MREIFTVVAGEMKKDASTAEITELIRTQISRRKFLIGTGAAGVGVASLCIFGCGGGSGGSNATAARQVFVANAQGMVVAEPSLCVGCRRCEAACVAYNEGSDGASTIVQPSIAKVKVNRNLNFGVAGVAVGSSQRGDGDYGNFRTVQDTCRQCPHPVPCQLACPHDAIEVIAPVNARVVNIDKCAGCGICVAACPWAMTSLTGPVNASLTHATKCTLCNGNPECVQACPGGALKYLPWTDRTKDVPPRQAVPSSLQFAAGVLDSCNKCH
jgi:Fe-S-cluster-containing hydrogenase component 2